MRLKHSPQPFDPVQQKADCLKFSKIHFDLPLEIL